MLMGGAYVGVTEGFLTEGWSAAILASLIVAHPLTAILALSLIHGEHLPRRRPAGLLLLIPVPFLLLLAAGSGWSRADLYAPSPLGAFLAICLASAVAETVYVRMTSPLLATDAFWINAGLVALLVAGPIYSFELEALNFTEAAGSNVAAPFALLALALAAFHSEPFPAAYPRHGRRWSGEASVGEGLAFVFDETKPKYASAISRLEASKGRPVLVLSRSAEPPRLTEGRPLEVSLIPDRHAGLRTLGTAAEFLMRRPGGLVVLEGFADVVAIAGWPRASDLLLRLRQLVADSDGTLLVSTSRLTEGERDELRSLKLPWWVLPDPGAEAEAILVRHFGTGAGRLLDGFAHAHALRREDLSTVHVEALVHFLHRALGDLGRGTGDARAVEGLRAQVEQAARDLRSFAGRHPAELSAGGWPSQEDPRPEEQLLVRASEYWKGKEMEELFAAAQGLAERGSLHELARAVFVEHLGDAGESVFRSEIAKLGKRPEDLLARDLARLADRAAVDLSVMADVVDLAPEKDRIRRQIESLRRGLASLAGDDA